MAMVESRSVSLSIVLHALALLIAAFGLPALLPKKLSRRSPLIRDGAVRVYLQVPRNYIGSNGLQAGSLASIGVGTSRKL